MKVLRASSPQLRGPHPNLRKRRLVQVILLSLSVYCIAARVFGARPAYLVNIFKMTHQLAPGFEQEDTSSTAASKPILGVYQPADPNTYDQVVPQNVKPQIQDVADLMTDLYKLLIKMGYMEASHFAWPPHDNPRIDTEELALYGFTKDVVDLMQLLPYRIESNVENWNFGTDQGEFLRWGDFMPDPRRTLDEPERTQLREGYSYAHDLIDPFYAIDFAVPGIPEDRRDKDADDRNWEHEDGPYMKPTYLALSGCGNHGTVMVLNTENYHIWFIGQLEGSNDPHFEGNSHKEVPTDNGNDLSQFPSRPAPEFLKDIISRFETLRWLPGGMYGGPDDEQYEKYKSFYEKAGWPDSFSLAEFHRLRKESDDNEKALSRAWQPLNALDSMLYRIHHIAEERQRYDDAKTKASDRSLCKDESEFEWARKWLKRHGERYENPAAFWQKLQDSLREDLLQKQQELDLIRSKSGRFEGSTEEEVAEMERYFTREIEELQRNLADRNEEERSERMLSEAQQNAALVSDDVRRLYEEKKAAMNKGCSGYPRWFP